MNTLLNKISNHFNNKLPFVVYRKPNKNSVSGFFMKDDSLNYINNFKEKGFVFAPFNSKDKAVLFSLENALFVHEELQIDIKIDTKNYFSEENSSEEKHINIVEKAIEEIKKTDLQKIVISREEQIHLSNFDVLEIYKKLLISYKNAFVYVWFHPKVGLWFGATPETLLYASKSTFKTMSLAGTQVFTNTENPIWKSKELQEQQLVTDFIENQLKNISNNLKIDKRETVKAGNLLHLKTKVAGVLNEKETLEKLIRALHPTPAVCGLPRNKAKKFILRNENYNRSFYTGFLGELNLKRSDSDKESSQLFVNLRCMKIENNIASIFVGGGITKDSNALREWEETVSKALTMKRVL